jgi:fatty-acid desaturase
MDNDGIAFRNRAYDAEKTLELMIKFLEWKGLYNEYMRWKEAHKEDKKPEWREF